MKYLIRIAVTLSVAILAFTADITSDSSQSLPGFNLVSEAQAIAGRQRRTRRRGVAVGYSAGKASASSQQQAAPPPQEAAPAPAPQETAPAG